MFPTTPNTALSTYDTALYKKVKRLSKVQLATCMGILVLGVLVGATEIVSRWQKQNGENVYFDIPEELSSRRLAQVGVLFGLSGWITLCLSVVILQGSSMFLNLVNCFMWLIVKIMLILYILMSTSSKIWEQTEEHATIIAHFVLVILDLYCLRLMFVFLDQIAKYQEQQLDSLLVTVTSIAERNNEKTSNIL